MKQTKLSWQGQSISLTSENVQFSGDPLSDMNLYGALPHIKKKFKMRKAFSLLEIMVVVLILGLLASVVVPNLVGKSEEAKKKLACINMKSTGELLEMFKLDNGVYPDTSEGLKALKQNPDSSKYPNYAENAYANSKAKLKDPYKRDFIYINNDSDYEIISLGADGKEGGENEKADVKLSECKF